MNPLYKLEELKKLSLDELKAIADKLDVKVDKASDADIEKIAFQIVDAQAVSATGVQAPKAKADDSKVTKKVSKPHKESNTNKTIKKNKDETADKDHTTAPSKEQAASKPTSKKNKPKADNNTPKNKKNEILAFMPEIEAEGIIEMMPEGYAFLRSSDYNYLTSPDDVYVSHNLIRQYRLITGDTVQGKLRVPREGERYFAMEHITMVNYDNADQLRRRSSFEHLTPIFPNEKINVVESTSIRGKKIDCATRMVDIFAPIGKGQRGMIVAPPKAGKTTLMKNIANGIASNHPEIYLIILLINERPEEVTDMSRSVNAEVIASNFDEPPENHVKVAEMVIEKAKRMVESGKDVVILLDSLTRLARAYNTVLPSSGKILSGGVDANALQKPKRFFGAARNIEEGGSLTILSTALVETGSKMDEVIFEEFKGTGNMEVQLDRKLVSKGLYPGIDIRGCGTRRDDLLHSDHDFDRIKMLQRFFGEMTSKEALTSLIKNLSETSDNKEFLSKMQY